MALVDDQVVINTQDSGQEVDWNVSGHVGVSLNDSTSQVPIYREGANCGDGTLQASTGTYTDDIVSTAINNGIRGDKLYVIWLWMTSNVTIDATTDILVGISDGLAWTGNGGLWNMRPLFQSVDRGGWQPCAIYPTLPDQTIGTFASLAKGAILSHRIDIDNSLGSQVRLFGIEQAFFISYIGGHSQTVTLDNLVSHSKDKTNNRDSGMINSLSKSYRSQVTIRLGDASASGLTSFSEQSKIIHWDNFNINHEIGWDFINDVSGDELHFQLGDFIGGAPVSGVIAFWNNGASSVFVGQDNCDKFRIYAGSFASSGVINLPTHIASRGVVSDLVVISAGGTGYAVNDVLTGVSGTGTKVTFTVTTVSAGAITALTMTTEGNYTVDPTNPDTTTVVPAGGTGATLNYTLREYTECKSYTFDGCGEVDIGDVTFEDNTILNSVSGVKYTGTGARLSKNTSYIGCTDAIHFDTAQTITLDGDKFSGNTTDIHFSGAGTLTINKINNANPITSRVSGGGTVVINNPAVVTTINVVDGNTNVVLQNARVLLMASDANGDYPFEESVTLTRVGATVTVSHTAHGMIVNDYAIIKGANQTEYLGVHQISNVTANSYDYTIAGTPITPATGTITSTGGLINGLTDVTGKITVTRAFTLNTPVKGFVRKSTVSPRFKTFSLDGNTIDSSSGLTINLRLVLDE